MRKSRMVVTLGVAAAGVMALTGCRAALPPTNPATPADFTITQIATQNKASFAVTGELAGNLKTQEILTTSLLTSTNPGPPVPVPGEVYLNQKVGNAWQQTLIVPASENIVFPNKPTIADLNRDGKNDFIISAGYFFSKYSGNLPTGSITWWENKGNGSFLRHNVLTNVVGAYHSAVFVDLDNDGKKDIVTGFEDGGFPGYPFGPPIAPETHIQFLKGDGAGNFAAPVNLSNNAGSLPVVFDVNADGKLDIATAQYFGVKTNAFPPPPAPASVTDESFIWLENTSTGGALTAANFSKHVIARGLGESFQIIPVDNIDGKGQYGAIGVNHTNPNLPPSPTGAAPSQVVRLTPGADVTQPWNVSVVADGFNSDARQGQAAPGTTDSGDLDGDGDIDLATDGDGDIGKYFIERKADGSWVKHNVASEYGVPGTNYGQGSVVIDDIDNDGKNEMIFASYNANGLFIMSRDAGTGGKFPAAPHVPDALLRY